MTADPTAELLRLEGLLLTPAARADPDVLATLLAESFEEFGSSGRRYDRSAVMAALRAEPACGPIRTMHDPAVHLLATDLALVTYRAVRTGPDGTVTTLRSSVWQRQAGQWRMRFHQGTRVP